MGEGTPVELMSIEGQKKARAALTGKRRTIVRMAANGLTDDHIAAEMGLSRDSVLHYWKTIKQALGTRNRAHVVAVAVALGLVKATDIRLPGKQTNEQMRPQV